MTLVGDDAAPQIAKVVRNIQSLVVGTFEDVAEQVSDYLKEEGNHLPTRAETKNFFDDVDKLPNDIAPNRSTTFPHQGKTRKT